MSKKEYLYIKSHKIPLYRGYFVIILSNSVDKLRKYLPDFDNKEIYAHSWYEKYRSKQGFIMVLNFDNAYREITHGVIAHEAMHLTNMIASLRGIEPDFNNDEHLAYLTEWIVDTVYKFIPKNKII